MELFRCPSSEIESLEFFLVEIHLQSMTEEPPKKRKRNESNYKSLIQYNASLLSYIHNLEFLLSETNRKHTRVSLKMKNNINEYVKALNQAGYSIPFPSDNLLSPIRPADLSVIWEKSKEDTVELPNPLLN